MAKIKELIRADAGVSRLAEGAEQSLRMGIDGSVVVMTWKQAMIEEGRAFGFAVGALSTGITGGGTGTVIDQNQPEFLIGVPTGTIIYPKRIMISVEPGLNQVVEDDRYEILIAMDTGKTFNTGTSGTSVAETPLNLNNTHARKSACTCRSKFGVDTGNADIDMELAHAVRVIDLVTSLAGCTQAQFLGIPGFELLYEPDEPMKITGPAMVLGYWGGTHGVLGFATVEWYEL